MMTLRGVKGSVPEFLVFLTGRLSRGCQRSPVFCTQLGQITGYRAAEEEQVLCLSSLQTKPGVFDGSCDSDSSLLLVLTLGHKTIDHLAHNYLGSVGQFLR